MTGRRSLSVVVFSGGRGSSVLSKELITHPDIALTLAINGYDDGLSTGEVRRFLGDSLGPSDFRKNASHLARVLHSSPDEAIALLDRRLPDGCTREQAIGILEAIDGPIGQRLGTLCRGGEADWPSLCVLGLRDRQWRCRFLSALEPPVQCRR